jgi:DNA (cytosine-5)-methyltransferase 1
MGDLTAIDLFAGLGGWGFGAEQAGFRVQWAGNHWPVAVAAHQRNHPDTEAVCVDLRVVDWTRVPRANVSRALCEALRAAA